MCWGSGVCEACYIDAIRKSYTFELERVRYAMEVGGRSVLMVTALAAFFSLLLTSLLMLILTKPLIEVSNVAKEVVAGNIKSRARIWSRDEIGEVAISGERPALRLIENVIPGKTVDRCSPRTHCRPVRS